MRAWEHWRQSQCKWEDECEERERMSGWEDECVGRDGNVCLVQRSQDGRMSVMCDEGGMLVDEA